MLWGKFVIHCSSFIIVIVLSLFRTNQALANIFVLIYLMVLRLSTFIHPKIDIPKGQGIMSVWVYDWITPNSIGAQIVALLLVFIQAVLVNQLVGRYRLTGEGTLLPGVFYCLVASFTPEFLSLSPLLMGNTFLIIAVYNLFAVYKNVRCADTIFDIGLWIGVASLFQFSFSILVIWAIVGLAILRSISLKEIMMVILGFLVPNFLMGVYLYYNNSLPSFFQNHIAENIGFLHMLDKSLPLDYIKIGIIGVLILITVLTSGRFFSKRNMAAQKYISILFWLMFFAATTLLVQSNFHMGHLVIFAIPLGILLALTFINIPPAIAEALHTLLFVSALLFQFEYMLV